MDLWRWKEKPTAPVISGSDGSGVVAAVGEGLPTGWTGKEVVINPGMHRGENSAVFSGAFEILGDPANGTFAGYVAVPQAYVHPVTPHSGLKEAAALPMASLTAYRALFTKARLTAGDNVLVTGIGGGAALQMAVAAAADAYVTSSSDEKINKAMALGAKGGFNYKDPDRVTEAREKAGGFDVIIDSAGGDGFAQLTGAAPPGARIVLFGKTAGNINGLKPGLIFNKQLRIEGAVTGTPGEFAAMPAYFTNNTV